MSDREAMARAVALSRNGFPAPNPHVGCVLVRDGQTVGEGWHEFAGGPHAEVNALRQAGDRARGATAFVTLEPCNHTGRTGPCSEALIAAGVARVVVACPDPNPKAAGGVDRLKAAGIDVEVGLLQAEAEAANVQFLHAMRQKRPHVVLKAAMTLDGRIALPSGESQWITSEAARERAHRLRAECGAVLVGRGTVEADDPHLTARVPGVHNPPIRIVLDPKAKLDGTQRVFDGAAPTLHVVEIGHGHHQVSVPVGPEGFDLESLLHALFARQVHGVLVEGGATTIGRFLKAGLWDRLDLFVGPKLFGSGPSWLDVALGETLAEVPQARILSVESVGTDVHLVAVPG